MLIRRLHEIGRHLRVLQQLVRLHLIELLFLVLSRLRIRPQGLIVTRCIEHQRLIVLVLILDGFVGLIRIGSELGHRYAPRN